MVKIAELHPGDVVMIHGKGVVVSRAGEGHEFASVAGRCANGDTVIFWGLLGGSVERVKAARL